MILMKYLAAALSVLALVLSGTTFYYRFQMNEALEDVRLIKAEMGALVERLKAADARADAAEGKLAAETGRLIQTHRTEIAEITRKSNERERKLQRAVSEQLALLNSCRLSSGVVGLLNSGTAVPAEGDSGSSAAAGAGGAPAADAAAETGPSCADLAIWAGQVREAKELNDRQLVDLQTHYNNVRQASLGALQ